MEAFAALIVHSPVKARKIAVVREGALTRMQSRRIGQQRSSYEVFEKIEDVNAWLLEE